MTIKDMERRTGLTSKSIRYYESKGLITVDRQEDNNYREYTQENLQQLKRIKLYRYLDFSIEEIKELQNPKNDIEAIFINKQKKFADITEESESKSEMLEKLIKDAKTKKDNLEDYIKEIEYWETEEGEEARERLRDFANLTLQSCIATSMISIAPIIYLFVSIINKSFDKLLPCAVLSLLATVWLTIVWKDYFSARKFEKERRKEKAKAERKDSIQEAIATILGIACMVIAMILGSYFLAPEGYLFYVNNQSILMVSMFLAVISAIFIWVMFGVRKENGGVFTKKQKISVIVTIIFMAVLCYCGATSFTYVTEDKIIAHSPLHPFGIEYDYNDVSEVKAGFGTKNFAFAEHKKKGNFSYTVKLKDGREIIMHTFSPNSDIERYSDTYLEIEEFDQKLMELDIKKESSEKGYEHCDFDKKYVDRFLRIINNK